MECAAFRRQHSPWTWNSCKRKNSKTCAATMPEKSTHVYSGAPENFRALISQRLRHMSTGKYFDPFLILIGIVVYGYHILTVMSLLLTVVSIKAGVAFICSFAWKSAVDFLAVRKTKRVFGLEAEWRRFAVNELFLLLYMALCLLPGYFSPLSGKKISWKNVQIDVYYL